MPGVKGGLYAGHTKPNLSLIMITFFVKAKLMFIASQCAESANTSTSTDFTQKPSAYPSTHILERPQNQFAGAQGRDEACPPSPCFKVPMCKEFPDVSLRASAVQMTPKLLPKLVNLSFSQPNSPRTPLVRTRPQPRLATPALALNYFRHRYIDKNIGSLTLNR